MLSLLMVVMAQLPMPELDAPGEFKEVDRGAWGVLSQRAVAGSSFKESRVQAEVPLGVARLCESVWKMATSGVTKGVIRHDLLVDEPNLRVIYQQVSYPVVSKRDYAMTLWRLAAPEGGPCRVRFRVTNERAPKLPKGFVRLEKLWGEWLFEPTRGGGAKVTYRMFSDPAGSLPAFVAHGQVREKTKFAFEEGMKAARRDAGVK